HTTRGWGGRSGMPRSIGRRARSRNDDHRTTRGTGRSADRRGRQWQHGDRTRRGPKDVPRRVLLPRRRDAELHERPQRAGLPSALRRGVVRRLVLERTAALLELGLRRLMPHLTLNYTVVLDVVFLALAVVVHGYRRAAHLRMMNAPRPDHGRPRHHHHGAG